MKKYEVDTYIKLLNIDKPNKIEISVIKFF